MDLSVKAGLVYDGCGAHGFTKESLLEDLKEIEGWMDEGYSYTLGKEEGDAVALLTQRGVFA